MPLPDEVYRERNSSPTMMVTIISVPTTSEGTGGQAVTDGDSVAGIDGRVDARQGAPTELTPHASGPPVGRSEGGRR